MTQYKSVDEKKLFFFSQFLQEENSFFILHGRYWNERNELSGEKKIRKTTIEINDIDNIKGNKFSAP